MKIFQQRAIGIEINYRPLAAGVYRCVILAVDGQGLIDDNGPCIYARLKREGITRVGFFYQRLQWQALCRRSIACNCMNYQSQ